MDHCTKLYVCQWLRISAIVLGFFDSLMKHRKIKNQGIIVSFIYSVNLKTTQRLSWCLNCNNHILKREKTQLIFLGFPLIASMLLFKWLCSQRISKNVSLQSRISEGWGIILKKIKLNKKDNQLLFQYLLQNVLLNV